MLTICAWCGDKLAGEIGKSVSHGICLHCLKTNFPELLSLFSQETLKQHGASEILRREPDGCQAA